MKGVTRDFKILHELLTRMGHTVTGQQFTIGPVVSEPMVDLNIFCETINSDWIPLAKNNWVFPNPEFWFDVYDYWIPKLDTILCKTKYAHEIFTGKGGAKAVFTGFMSEDHFRADVQRKRKVLHIAGGSQVKNTQSILDAWQMFDIPAELIGIGKHYPQAAAYPKTTFFATVEESFLIQ